MRRIIFAAYLVLVACGDDAAEREAARKESCSTTALPIITAREELDTALSEQNKYGIAEGSARLCVGNAAYQGAEQATTTPDTIIAACSKEVASYVAAELYRAKAGSSFSQAGTGIAEDIPAILRMDAKLTLHMARGEQCWKLRQPRSLERSGNRTERS